MRRVLARHIPTGNLYFLRYSGGDITALSDPKPFHSYLDNKVKLRSYFDLVAYHTSPQLLAWARVQEWQTLVEEVPGNLPNFM